jgi:chromosome segregation ATPase
MNIRVALVAAWLVLLVGCNTGDEESRTLIAEARKEQSSTKQLLHERDRYIEEVMQAVNVVYKDIEEARVKAGRLAARSTYPEAITQEGTLDSYHKLLADMDDIGSVVRDNRRRVGDLQNRLRRSSRRIAGLDSLVAGLRLTVVEREDEIAKLEMKVQKLESTIAEMTREAP